jgi:5-methylcytosine-specific restriction endonuclease McrBC regulatory subunit McrC
MSEEEKSPDSIWDEFAQALSAQGNSTGVSVEYDRNGRPTLRSGNKVGFIGFENEQGEQVSIVIEPKIAGSAVGMLCAILGVNLKKTFEFQERSVNTHQSPSAWLAALYVRELEHFLTNIRPRGEEREEELNGRIKGRMLMSQYIKRNYIQRRTHVPCRYLDWTMDNLPNQILKHTLKRCLDILRMQPNSAFQSSIGRGLTCMASFYGVRDVAIGLQDFSRVRPMIAGSFRPYDQMVNLAWMIASNIDMFELDGDTKQSAPLLSVQEQKDSGGLKWDLIDMPVLFEEYLRFISLGKKRRLDLKVDNSSNRWVFTDRRIEPDCVVERIEGTVVLDAKYKRMFDDLPSSGQAHLDESVLRMKEWDRFVVGLATDDVVSFGLKTHKPNLGDQYQVVAYATHRDVRTTYAGLVYPSNGEHDDTFPRMENLGYSEDSTQGVEVFFLSLRIDFDGIQDELRNGHFLKILDENVIRNNERGD